MLTPVILFAYFGPETVLPMTSVVATVVGLFMMFGRNTIRFLFRWRKNPVDGSKTADAARSPHFLAKNQDQQATARR